MPWAIIEAKRTIAEGRIGEDCHIRPLFDWLKYMA